MINIINDGLIFVKWDIKIAIPCVPPVVSFKGFSIRLKFKAAKKRQTNNIIYFCIFIPLLLLLFSLFLILLKKEEKLFLLIFSSSFNKWFK